MTNAERFFRNDNLAERRDKNQKLWHTHETQLLALLKPLVKKSRDDGLAKDYFIFDNNYKLLLAKIFGYNSEPKNETKIARFFRLRKKSASDWCQREREKNEFLLNFFLDNGFDVVLVPMWYMGPWEWKISTSELEFGKTNI